MNYKKAIEDFNNGTIDSERFQLVLDNDGGHWLCIDESLGDEKRQYLESVMVKKYGTPKGYSDIVDVLNGAGVNAAWC